MNKYLVITIDVEPDCTPSWKYSNPLTFNGVHEGIAKRLQPLFNKYSFTPTYLINNVVLEDEASCDTFRNLDGQYELGTHLHPEFIAPAKTEFEYAGKKGVANCCFYEPQIEYGKIESITRLFEKQFGKQPTSFRAGRFSAGSNTIQSLIKLNYKVDTSVTPFVRWDDRTREKAVDFRRAPNQPYWIDEKNVVNAGKNKNLLEVPVSIIGQRLSPKEYIKAVIRTKRIPYKGSKAVWLRPKFSGEAAFRKIIEVISEQNNDGPVVFNMMFHNVEVMPGLSPYSINESDAKNYLKSLDWFLSFCKDGNITGTSLSSLYDIYRNK